MIMVDPKRVELGITKHSAFADPVITDPKKSTNALRNAVLEMERRLRLLAEQGARTSISSTRKYARCRPNRAACLKKTRRSLKNSDAAVHPDPHRRTGGPDDAGRPQCGGIGHAAGADGAPVGMHLVLRRSAPAWTLSPALSKPISRRYQLPRGDARRQPDDPGWNGRGAFAGQGHMLFLPPGSSRFIRVHGAFVTETEINKVVDFWKAQAKPEYDQSYLIAGEEGDGEPEDVPRASRIRCTKKRSGWCSKWARRRPRRCSAGCVSATGARAHSRHDVSRRHHRPAGRQQAA